MTFEEHSLAVVENHSEGVSNGHEPLEHLAVEGYNPESAIRLAPAEFNGAEQLEQVEEGREEGGESGDADLSDVSAQAWQKWKDTVGGRGSFPLEIGGRGDYNDIFILVEEGLMDGGFITFDAGVT